MNAYISTALKLGYIENKILKIILIICETGGFITKIILVIFAAVDSF